MNQLNKMITLPQRLVQSNTVSTIETLRTLLIEKIKAQKMIAQLQEGVTGIDQSIRQRLAVAQSEHLPIPSLEQMEREAAQAVAVPRRTIHEARGKQSAVVALAQESLTRGKPLEVGDIMAYVRAQGVEVKNGRVIQAIMANLKQFGAVDVVEAKEGGRPRYKLVKPDQRYVEAAKAYHASRGH